MQAHDGPQLPSGGSAPRARRGTSGEQASAPDKRDLSAQVAMMAAKTKPWKSIFALVLAIGAAAASGWAHSLFPHFFARDNVVNQVVAAATAVAFCVFASAATIGLSGKVRDMLQPVVGTSHASVVRYALVLVGALTTLIVTLVLFGVPVGQLLLGGALTSVFVGIAAQQALSNVFAGMVLLLASPFRVGDAVRLRAGALGGTIDGTVSEIGITYLRIATADGVLSVPNSQVLNAVVGPLPPGASLTSPAQPAPAAAPSGPPGTVSPATAVIAPAAAAPPAPGPGEDPPGTDPK
ncbi:MAG TPA: mechanosensitive ion channel domain-containing protein [Trebonia sp.]|nr:mechanosensitive ion channel domain-containing protein [Trebonia sp.]